MREDIIAAQHFDGELYIKASDHHRIVLAKVEAEREACAKVCEEMELSPALSDLEKYRTRFIADAIRARGQS